MASVVSPLPRPRWSSFEETLPIPPGQHGIIWPHRGNHYDHPRHRHVALEVNLVVAGRGHYEVQGRCQALAPGSVLFIQPGQDHYVEERTRDFEMWILALQPELLERIERDGASSGTSDAADSCRVLSGDDVRWLDRDILRLSGNTSRAFLHAGLAYVMTGLDEGFRRSSSAPAAATMPEVWRCAELLEEDPSLSRDVLAERLGCNPDALSRAFPRELGVHLVDYRNRVRIRRFLRLASQRPTLLAACLEAGFGSYPQFHRVFVAETGLTPRAYLRGWRPAASTRVQKPS